jgi:phosphoesterase RecJ-like protein
MTNKLQWSEATEAVNAASSILAVTHLNPDGDAIGSLLGLVNALRERGKNVVAVVDGGVPEFLQYIPGQESVLSKLNAGEWELMISLDSSDNERTGEAGIYGRAHSSKIINLDHHPTNTLFGDIFLVLPEAVSAAEIVYRWLDYMQHPLSREVAVPLLTGMVTDTMGFRTSNVKAETLGIAQQLMAAGASLTEVMARTLLSTSYSTVELWKRSLPSTQLDGAVISADVTQADLRAARILEATDAGLVSFLNTVDEAMIAVVFKELPDGRVEISLRSKPGFDVGSVAFSLGGGGHKQASGATIAGPLEAAHQRVLPLLHDAVGAGKLVIA